MTNHSSRRSSTSVSAIVASSLFLFLTATLSAQLDPSWRVGAGGQTSVVASDGSFRIVNIASPDNFGVGGPGTAPDFLADEFIRVLGTNTVDGITRYAFSEPFQIENGKRYVVPHIFVTTTPPPLPTKITMSVPPTVLTAPGQSLQVAVSGVLGDGSTVDLTPRSAWTLYRTSNPFVAEVGPDGLVTARGTGLAFITAVNDGATTVGRVQVSLGDPLTVVEGRVVDADDQPVNAAVVTILGTSSATTGPDGRFTISGVPTLQGAISAFASSPAGTGSSTAIAPIPGAITDLGDIRILANSSGTDFAVCFQENYTGASTLDLFISGNVAGTGIVDIPGLSFMQTFSVSPGVVTTVTVPSSAAVTVNDGVSNRGVRVTSTVPISLYGLSRQSFTTDGFTAFPIDVLGLRYRVAAYGGTSFSSQFAVVATADATTVTITPRSNAGSHAAGVPYTVVLNRDQVYQLQTSTDLTGTLITSSAPVAVFSGHQCAFVPIGFSFCDHLIEQMPPVGYWGNEFSTVSLATRTGGDTFRILSDSDQTMVTIAGGTSETLMLQAGEFAERLLTNVNRITSTKPILVVQYSNGGAFDGTVGDPFMMLVAPDVRFRTSYTFTTPASGFASHFINLVVAAEDLTQVLIDGAPLIALDADPIPGTNRIGIQAAILAGNHFIAAPNPFGLYVYGFNDDDSYGYAGGL